MTERTKEKIEFKERRIKENQADIKKLTKVIDTLNSQNAKDTILNLQIDLSYSVMALRKDIETLKKEGC